MNIIKLIKLSEGGYMTTLQSGNYLIDGHPVSIIGTKKVQAKTTESIHKITVTETVIHLESSTGEQLSKEDYVEKLHRLSDVAAKDEKGTPIQWDDVEAQIKYLRFKAKWTPVKATITSIGDPIPCEVTHEIQSYEKHIRSMFYYGSDSCSIYQYNRFDFLHERALELIQDFNVEPSEKDTVTKHYTQENYVYGYAGETKGTMCVFGALPLILIGAKNMPMLRGNFSKMQHQKIIDEAKLKGILTDARNVCFGKVDEEHFDFRSLLDSLKYIQTKLEQTTSIKKTESNLKHASSKLGDVCKLIISQFEVDE